MRDPHVVELRYRLVLDGGDEFRDPPPVERERDAFSVRLADDLLTVTMKEHHPTIDSARVRVDSFLQDWVISAALQYRRRQVSFEYEDADVIDRDPPPPGEPHVITVSASIQGASTVRAKITVQRSAYPSPPDAFIASPDVQLMWTRYEQYQNGNEPLPSMAYFCLTVVAPADISRKDVSGLYNISLPILNTLSKLTSTRGDGTNARKAHNLEPLTSREEQWIREAVLVLIRRLGEHAAAPDSPKPKITMADLPSLKNGDVS